MLNVYVIVYLCLTTNVIKEVIHMLRLVMYWKQTKLNV